MAKLYNEIASKIGEKPIKEFKDKATGIRRLAAIQAKVNGGGKVSIADQVRLAKEEPDLPEDIEEFKKALQEDFGDPDLPPPAEKKVKVKTPRVKGAKRVNPFKPNPPTDLDVDSVESLRKGFDLRDDTNRARLVDFLLSNLDQYVTASQIIEQTYGKGKGGLGPMLLVLGGAKLKIEANGLPLEIRKERSEPKNPRIGLFVVVK